MGLISERSWRRPMHYLAIWIGISSVSPIRLLADSPAPELRDLMRQFQSLFSLTFSAEAVVQFPSGPGISDDFEILACPDEDSERTSANPSTKPVIGYFDYWASGQCYRTRSEVDRNLAPEMQAEVAYDGQRWRWLRPDGTLIDSPQDNAVILPMLPNPLLELLQFRYPTTDENSGRYVRLKDVQQDQVPDAFWAVDWTQVTLDGRDLERAVFPGGTYDGRPYVHHVYVEPGLQNMPVRIDRVSERGRESSAEFSDYRRIDTAAGPAYWPHKVFLEALDQGKRIGWMTFTITNLAVDVEIPASTLAIPHERGSRVWIDEQQRFLGTGQ